MKIRVLYLIIPMIFVLSISFAENKITVEDIFGTWINSDYNEKYGRAKEIHHPDGTSEWYSKETDTEHGYTLKYTITDIWYNEEGNLWIKSTFFTIEDSSTGYIIFKFSDSGKVRESVWSEAKYPDEMSPIGGNYAIHYRHEELYGTWINPDYGGEWAVQKIIIDPDGTEKRFHSRHDLATGWTCPITLIDKWTDSEGNIWYRMFWTLGNEEWKMYEIIRISNSGKTLEYVFSEIDFPKGISADHPDYRIYYRQE